VILTLVASGASQAEAANQVKPLVGKRITAVIDVTAKPALANTKPGQTITLGGQAFTPIIRLTSRKF
jgi:hypothetical protein